MQKTLGWIIGIIILAILIGGGYAIFHKKSPTSGSSNNSNASSQSTGTVNNSVLMTKTNSTFGNYLTDPQGNALYTIGSGTTGVTACTGSCLSAWPVYQDTGSTSGLPTDVSTIKRSDNGQAQYTYKGMPLYYFTGDSKGQVTGNGVSGFVVAKP